MCEEQNKNIEADSEARDAYDEFEERIGRIGIGIVAIWRDLNTSERVSHVLTLATLAALIAYTSYTVKIYKASNESAGAAMLAANTARKELELSQRPSVSITDIKVISPLVFDSNGVHTTITYSFVNTGHSVAIDGEDFWDFMVPYMETPSPVIKRDQLCKAAGEGSARIEEKKLGAFSQSWFPGQPQPMTFKISWNINDIKKAMIAPTTMFPNVTLPPTKFFEPVMVACVAYRSSFTTTEYHTGYILVLTNSKTSKNPFFVGHGEIPAEDLKFVYHPFYGVFAD